MPTVPITVPGVGESITEGILSRWMKPDGSSVKAGEPLFELETDKATNVDPGPALGRAEDRRRPKGETVADRRHGRHDRSVRHARRAPSADDRRSPSAAAPRRPPRSPNGRGGSGPGAPSVRSRRPSDGSPPRRRSTRLPDRRDRAGADGSPRGTCSTSTRSVDGRSDGPGRAPASGRPAAGDCAAARAAPAPSGDRETRQRMSGIRQKIAQRLVEAQQTAAILTTFNEADMSRVMDLRATLQGAVPEEARRRPGLHVVLRQGADRGAQGVPRRQRPDRGQRDRLSTTTTTSAWPSAPSAG